MERETAGRDSIPGFGSAIRARRHELQMTVTDVAELTGTHHANISKLEHGHRAPSLRLAVALAGALGWNILQLVEAADAAAAEKSSTEPSARMKSDGRSGEKKQRKRTTGRRKGAR